MFERDPDASGLVFWSVMLVMISVLGFVALTVR
jgi:hypothetical protein